MAGKKIGKQSVRFETPPRVAGSATVVGDMEGKGPLGHYFDTIVTDSYYGEKCWEDAETKMLKEAVINSISNSGKEEADIDYLFSSDLLNQCTVSSFMARDVDICHLGIYSACASFAEGLILGAMLLDGGFADNVAVGTSSHHDTAERQYRFPIELGTQRPMWAQWTVTGAGSVILDRLSGSPKVTAATIGKVVDRGVKDAFDMGSAMSAAAVDTLEAHFEDFGISPSYYDVIATGDLGQVGMDVTKELLRRHNYDVEKILTDCGVLIYDKEKQDVHSGGSGMGSSSTVFSAYFLKEFRAGKYQRMLLVSTGALHSPTRVNQGGTIPTVAHAVSLES